MIDIMMMIASYIHDDVDNDRIAHSSAIYDAANFGKDGRTNKAILEVGLIKLYSLKGVMLKTEMFWSSILWVYY